MLGVDRNGAEVATATYEYEICFRCHGDNTPDVEFVPRVVGSTNTRLDFDANNPSYHPVVEMGRSVDVPSLPSALSPRMTPADRIGCTSCHADDEGGVTRAARLRLSADPHRALRHRRRVGRELRQLRPLLPLPRARRASSATRAFAPRAFRTTPSGGGHSGHLAAGAPCSACHDPHGVPAGGSAAFFSTGDHTHLINFDTRIVAPLPGADLPVFKDTGSRSGNCTLICHGVDHLQTSYP